MSRAIALLCCLFVTSAWAETAKADVVIEGITFTDPPAWLSESAVKGVLSDIKARTGWKGEGAKVVFQKDSGKWSLMLIGINAPGAPIGAYANGSAREIQVSPKIEPGEFLPLFGHEIGHIVSWDLYHGRLPSWLEEGYAEWIGKSPNLSFSWMMRRNERVDPRFLDDPMRKNNLNDKINFAYELSYASMLFFSERCPKLGDFLQGLIETNEFDKYLNEKCGVNVFVAELWQWINKQQGLGDAPRY